MMLLKFLKSSGFLLMILLTAAMATAQVTQPVRYEREQKNSDDQFHIIPLGRDGIALFRERDKYKQNNRLWELIFLDADLKEKTALELEIKERHRMIGYEVSPKNIYFLFRTGETSKNDFVLIDISLDGVERGRYAIKPDLDFRLTHFIKAGRNFVFGGYVNNEAVIILFDPAANSLKVVPGFFQKDTELVDLRTNENGTFNTILMDRSNRGEKKVVFRTFDDTGKQLLEDDVVVDENITLLTAMTSTLQREDLIIAGTWGDRNAKQSSGFFTLSVDPFSEQKIKYVDYGSLENFLNYLNQKRAAKIKKQTKELASVGRKPAFSAHVMPFRIAEDDKGFYILAEVYQPSSSSSSMYSNNPYYYNPFYSPYGYSPFYNGFYYPGMRRMYRPYMYGPNSRNSNEIKSLETVVIHVDAQGNVKWDQSLKLDEVRIPALEQVGDFAVVNDVAFLLYKKESELKIKSIPLGGGDALEEAQKIRTSDENDVIRSEKDTDSGVRHWYGNSFYVWGYQTIRNATRKDRVRDVFYINRIDTSM